MAGCGKNGRKSQAGDDQEPAEHDGRKRLRNLVGAVTLNRKEDGKNEGGNPRIGPGGGIRHVM